MRPKILLTPDVETEISQKRGDHQKVHVMSRAYVEAVLNAGGLPVVCAYGAEDLVDEVDGVVLTGGAFDVDPALFGEPAHEKLGTLKPDRTASEREVYRRAMDRGLPVLGICGGMQLMNVERGGSLYQDLDSEAPSDVAHEQAISKSLAGHRVVVERDTLLYRAVETVDLAVNSTHHQAIKSLGQGLVASAIADDGIVEAFEDPARDFFVAVQWHPESMADPAHLEIYKALVRASAPVGLLRPSRRP